MALGPADREFVRGINRRVADRALEPDDPLYEPIHEQINEDDPVAWPLPQAHGTRLIRPGNSPEDMPWSA